MRRRLFPLLTACAPCRITHWCYNPLVLRRRTCCPVSNTLFFFSSFPSLSLSLSISLIFVPVLHPPASFYDARSIGTPYARFATANEKHSIVCYVARWPGQVFVESRQPELTNDWRWRYFGVDACCQGIRARWRKRNDSWMWYFEDLREMSRFFSRIYLCCVFRIIKGIN